MSVELHAIIDSMSVPKGFTIVEMVVVVAVLAILVGMVSIAWRNNETQDRDARRDLNMTVLKGHLEAYYDAHGKYPMLADINSLAVPGVDINILIAPGASGGVSSLKSTSTPSNIEYGYITYDASRVICTSGSNCGNKFSLYWKSELTGSVESIGGLR